MPGNEKQILKLHAAAEVGNSNTFSGSFIKLVNHEIAGIKVYASTEELNRLDVQNFNARLNTNCIYGQLTGNCNSPRAIELLNLCAIPFSVNLRWFKISDKNDFNERTTGPELLCCSALEYYVSNISKPALQQLINQIQGK